MAHSTNQLVVPEQPPTGTHVAVIGAGYVGLTIAAGLAYLGHTVVCADSASWKVALLRAGKIPFLEDGMPELVARMARIGRLEFTSDTRESVSASQFVFLCVPTPQGAGGEADLHHVLRAADEIRPVLAAGAVVVTKSTVPVGTADLVSQRLRRHDVAVVANPEFLAEGTALRDFLSPDRIVIGSRRPDASAAVADLYAAIGSDVIITDVRSAEMTKYVSNAFLATKLSFVNSIAELCAAAGADIRAVTRGMGADHRIGTAFLHPGPGWGGSCFPKDMQALLRIGADNAVRLPVVSAAIDVNDHMHQSIVRQVIAAIPASLPERIVAVWGLTYKAGTDDLRDSPALRIIDGLRAEGLTVQVYDPTRRDPLAGMSICTDAYLACQNAAVLVVTTEWPEFARADFSRVRTMMAGRAVIDTRNVLDPATVRAADLGYAGIGLPGTPPPSQVDVSESALTADSRALTPVSR